jgi:hypothetical protein
MVGLGRDGILVDDYKRIVRSLATQLNGQRNLFYRHDSNAYR